MEGDLSAELRASIELHLQNCAHCTAIYDGTRNIVQLLTSETAIELPAGVSRRIYFFCRLLGRRTSFRYPEANNFRDAPLPPRDA